jgi:hypothetical protein
LQKTEAFPNGKPSSLIVSRSPFFHDLVLLNFLNAASLVGSPAAGRLPPKDLAYDSDRVRYVSVAV